jgi:drug/metabolite transporter (DMT)-like permease
MMFNLILQILAALLMFAFAAYVLHRYLIRGKLHFLFWGIGLAMFGIASAAGAILGLAWNRWVFFAWYLFGAILTAAWIGHGTVYLLVRKTKAHVLTTVLLLASVIALFLLLVALSDLDSSKFNSSVPISEQYREIMPPISNGGLVRLSTPFFNIYGLIALAGGAIWSSYLFWRKRVLPNRVIGNVLIALGALIIASASTLTRLGLGSVLYIGQVVAAIMMFSGFLVAAAPRPATNKDSTQTTSALKPSR